jgi:hypothetical protein
LDNGLDKFYTNKDIAKYCADIFMGYVPEDSTIVEPSAGDGAFIEYTSIAIDIEPENNKIKKLDFFDFIAKDYKYYLGNPPFGKNSALAKKFFNHAAKGRGVIGFILPRTFRKVTVTNAIDLNFHKVYEEILPENSFLLEGKVKAVPCVFQVWEYRDVKRDKVKLKTTHPDFTFTTVENCDFSLRRVGANAGKINPHNNFAISSNYFIQGKVLDNFKSLEQEFIKLSKDTAGNPSLGKGEIVLLYDKLITSI